MGSRVKEEERNERAIRGLLKLPGNSSCINCNSMFPDTTPADYSTIDVRVTDAGLARLKEMPMPVKIYVGASNVQIRNLTLTKKGVKLFIKDNGLSLGEVKDLIWGLIACNLYHMGLINMNHYSGTDEGITEADEGLLNDDFLTRYSTLTRAVVVLALVSYCQGGWEDGLRWYESFCNVQGDFLNESRLRNTIKLIIAGNKFAKIMTVITINDVRGLNNVFTYRLKRFSAPKLVKQAMEILPYPHILKYFAKSHVKHYKIIDEAGLIAQIAGGPLRAFCTGVADPLRIGSRNGHLALASLAPFPDFPEYDDVIRKAYIILKAAKYNFGMWYQGERAMRAYTASDMKFKSIVEATLDKLHKEADRAVDLDSLDTDGVMAASDGVEVLNLLSSWKYSR